MDNDATADLFTTCRTLLTADGYTIVAIPPAAANDVKHLCQLVPAARQAQLGWLEHIVVITTPTHRARPRCDRGSQFRSRKFVRALNQHHMIGSMGRVGAAGDNAAMESFFGLLQNNVLDRRTWTTRQ